MIAKDPSYYWDHQSTWWTLGTIYTTHLKFYQLMNTARQVLRPASSRVIKIQVKRSFTPYIYCYNELKALLCFASLFLFNIQTLTWSKYFLLQRLILISYHLELDRILGDYWGETRRWWYVTCSSHDWCPAETHMETDPGWSWRRWWYSSGN